MLHSSAHPPAGLHAQALLGTSSLTGDASVHPVRYINCLAIAAGGSNIFRFLGAVKELRKRNLRPRAIHTCSAGGPTGAVIAADIDPDLAVEVMLDLIHRRLDSGLLVHSLVNSDFQRLLLSGGTSWSPRQAYTEFCEALDLDWPEDIDFELQACAIHAPEWQVLTPWNLANFSPRPVYFNKNSGVSLVDALTMSGTAPGMAVPVVRNDPEHGRELIVDGAVWNFIPRLVGPSIVIKARKLTDLGFYVPKGVDVFNPSAWMRSAEEYRKLFKLPMDFVYQWLEVNMPLAADRRHVGSEHLVLSFGDEQDGTLKPAGLNTGADDSVYRAMYESAQRITAMELDKAEADGTLANYLS